MAKTGSSGVSFASERLTAAPTTPAAEPAASAPCAQLKLKKLTVLYRRML